MTLDPASICYLQDSPREVPGTISKEILGKFLGDIAWHVLGEISEGFPCCIVEESLSMVLGEIPGDIVWVFLGEISGKVPWGIVGDVPGEILCENLGKVLQQILN